jgi:hypothetical protein
MNRRGVLWHLSSLGGGLLAGSHVGATTSPRVSANPTVFFAPPDGRNALVRFVVEGVDAPAGRLRVFDRSGRQVGTAGVIRRGDQLYGELWLPLDRATEIVSQLEAPGLRGPLRTSHRLTPARRWTLYWVTATNLLKGQVVPPEFLDHAEFLRLAENIPPEFDPFLLDADGLLNRVATAPLMLAGSGIHWAGVQDAASPLARVESRDGSFVIAVLLAVARTSGDLGLAAGRNEMARQVEQWLEGPGAQLADDAHAVALMVGPDAGEAGATAERLADWNARFAFPRIITGRPQELLGIIQSRASLAARRAGGNQGAAEARWQPLEHDSSARAARMFDPLLTRLSASATGLAALAAQFAFRVPGTLVVNPTPFTATSVAVMPDGTERVITDVPSLGYVCVPYPGYADRPPRENDGRWVAVPGSDNDLTLDGRDFELRIDLESGAIRSLVTRANGRQWARRAGLNTAGGFRLDTLQKFRNNGVGTRIVVGRRSGEVTLKSSITTYDGLPWVDITNEQNVPTEPVTYGFGVNLESPTVSWEVPAGFDDRAGPVDRLVYLRWLKLMTGSDSVLFRGLDAPVASITADSEIVSVAPRRARYRMGFASGFSSPSDPWAFGWGCEPLLALPVPGTGQATLPSFGSLLVTDQPGVCIIELRADGEGNIVIYLQELIGVGRDIIVGPGVLTFRTARRVDFARVDRGELPILPSGGTTAPVQAFGITAVRLGGVELAGQ